MKKYICCKKQQSKRINKGIQKSNIHQCKWTFGKDWEKIECWCHRQVPTSPNETNRTVANKCR